MADSDSDAALTEAGGSESDWESDWDESDWDEDVAAGCATRCISKQELELRCFLVLNMVESWSKTATGIFNGLGKRARCPDRPGNMPRAI
jgi:hypothetical protein